ncbi:MAG: FtsQ-type POTRA domain-containing protein [Candidatus Lambdaproteobacteria bacterium]|nr:FtsQ-type POTRA domain-containing protein [Candidatus Lambdaproteobacteria bacterium]
MKDFKTSRRPATPSLLRRLLALLLRRGRSRSRSFAPQGFTPLQPPNPQPRAGRRRWPAWLRLRAKPLAWAFYLGATWLLVGLASEGWAIWSAPLAEVQVRGNRSLRSDRIVAAAGLRQGIALSDVDPFEVAQALAALPEVKGANVRRLFPGRLAIEIEERAPAARVALAHGSAVIDEEGVVLALQAPGTATETAPALPLIRGAATSAVPGTRLEGAALARAWRVLRAGRAQGIVSGATVVDVRDPSTVELELPPRGQRLRAQTRSFDAALGAYLAVAPLLSALSPAPRVVDLRLAGDPARPRIVVQR